MSTCSNPSCKNTEKLQRCSCCFSVAYCGKKCQCEHWKTHKLMCKPLPNVVEPAPDPKPLPNVVEPAPDPSLPNVVEPLDTASNSSSSFSLASLIEEEIKDLFGNAGVSGAEMDAILDIIRSKPPTPAESAEFASILSETPELLSGNSEFLDKVKEECRMLAGLTGLTYRVMKR